MNYAKLENSLRLQRLLAFLEDGQWHSSMNCIAGAQVAAISSAITELRFNGVEIETRQEGRVWYYRLKPAA